MAKYTVNEWDQKKIHGINTHNKIKTSQRNHTKANSNVETSNDQNKTLVMLLKANEIQASMDEVRLWKDVIKPHKS